MSYWINLRDEKGELAEVDLFEEGGTQVMGGSDRAELNVTYNYAKHFNFRDMQGKRAADTVPQLEEAIKSFGVDRSDDYWAPTLGNVGYTLAILLRWAKQHPEYTWEIH